VAFHSSLIGFGAPLAMCLPISSPIPQPLFGPDNPLIHHANNAAHFPTFRALLLSCVESHFLFFVVSHFLFFVVSDDVNKALLMRAGIPVFCFRVDLSTPASFPAEH
jgi:hypothetical protein